MPSFSLRLPLISSLALGAVAVAAVACGSSTDPGSSGFGDAGGGGESATHGHGSGGDGNHFNPVGPSASSSSSAASGSGGGPGPSCGDGRVDAGEACDDGNTDSADGCAGDCSAIENGFACPVPGEACVSTVVCGDGSITGAETCDDGNAAPGDGCDDHCQVEAGWVCPNPGERCEAATCGDGIIAGDEQCEDGSMPPGSSAGCDASCHLVPGYVCPTPGQACRATVCGDGVAEGSEQCDDGNNDLGDGCSPDCTREPDCTGSPAAPCTTSCGDGIKLPNGTEACEDGNTRAGDGCAPDCTVEPGYTCTDVAVDPTQLVLPIVIRDFSSAHPDFEKFLGDDRGVVQALLGVDQKPVYAGAPTTPTTTGQADFDQWYRDVPGTNFTFLQTITLAQIPGGDFQYANGAFFPIDGLGFGNEGNGNNFHFTSEVRYWFEYKGGETLDFTGDDDVWVFVNKRLAVDLGGVHGAENGSITLDATAATTFNLAVGKIYEIVVFQAERHTTQSNYRLTLGNFVNAKSVCHSVCGDGIKTPDEACDDGVNDGSYGSCTPDCKKGQYCGDGVVQDGFEECDDGTNLSPYGGCAPGCMLGAFCGDGNVDSLFGEQCDDGMNMGGYGECAPGCVLGPRCGDGIKNGSEECDDGNQDNNDGCDVTCHKVQVH